MPDGLAVVQAHLEAIRERHEAVVTGPPINDVSCGECNPYTVRACPCPTHVDVKLALLALVVERERATTRDEQIASLTNIAKWADEVNRWSCEPEGAGFDHSIVCLSNALEDHRRLHALGAGDGA